MSFPSPLIINLAPTGMVPVRSQSPHVPLSPEEIIADAVLCAQHGASMFHLHARDADGVPTDDAATYESIIRGIRAYSPELIIVTTTSGRRSPEVEKRASSLRLHHSLRPDMASLTLGSMNFAREASLNSPDTIMQLAGIMQELGIKPELEVFDLGMVNFAKVLIDKGLLKPPYYFNIILGNPATAQAKLLHLATIVADLPPESIWSLGGIGRYQTAANGLGVVMAHGVRTGLEDNLWLDDERTTLATNAQLVARVAAQASALGRPIATASIARNMLGLASRVSL
ncbi:3-keto-5-aminohexanoate cleavage protein [Undibacterium sp. CY18W]|uniref:3-keto-5-aminohexanoate cleavage protein n=1 Tax=Undibacterium hunanense TaxID=2762292 RepID=A0ABR6ZZ47_9BURK|nr:3-keto-5-aminohexanoate cleavage protein [Undibacterium hunanense]MBC3921152.1 3-keto-5-aminohexanoate cleavage protein [Undibacterium hunanense]